MTNLLVYPITLDSHRDSFTVFLHGDDHYGARTCDERSILRFVDKVVERKKERNVRVNLMGDYVYSFPREDNRNDEGEQKNPDALMLYSEFRDIIEPIAPKVDCCLTGNHDNDWVKKERINYVNWLCAELKMPYGDYETYIRYKVKVKGGVNRRNVDIVLWHGDGGGRTAGSAFNKAKNPIEVHRIANIYAMGHVHRLGMLHEQWLLPDEDKMEFVDNDQYIVLTGGYQKGYVPPKSTYISKKMLPPVAIGAVELTIQPFRDIGSRDVLDVQFSEVR